MNPWRLVVDVGGTNVRFARVAEDGSIFAVSSLKVSAHPRFREALLSYLETTDGRQGCSGCLLGAAGPVENGRIHLTNGLWVLDPAEIMQVLGNVPVRVLNDLEAVAAALPYLEAKDLAAIGTDIPDPSRRYSLLVINVGTGFGAALAIPQHGRWWIQATEPGHMTLDALDIGLTDVPRSPFVEELLSGGGCARLYKRLGGLGGPDEEETILSRTEADEPAARTAAILNKALARFAGDLVLATGAWGGVYICGSVGRALARSADAVAFRYDFESKHSMRALMSRVPIAIINREHIALLGLSKIAAVA